MAIQDLPSELLDAVMIQLARSPPDSYATPWGIRALRNAALVCRAWNEAASRHLFHTLRLTHGLQPSRTDEPPRFDTEEGQRAMFPKWYHIMSLDVAKRAARKVVVDTVPEQFPDDMLGQSWREWNEASNTKLPAFEGAIDRIGELPGLEALEVHFSYRCAGKQSEGNSDDYEPFAARQNALQAVFRAINQRKLKGPVPTLPSLTWP